jgi:hypothetical protein
MDSGVVVRILILIVLLFLPMVPTIWAIRDIAYKSFPRLKTKVIWFAVVTLLPPIGALIYIFVGRPRVGIDVEQSAPRDASDELRLE